MTASRRSTPVTRRTTRRAEAVVVAAGLLALAGCGRDGATMSPAAGKSPNRMSATELSDYAARVGPTHAVNAVVEASPSPRPAPQAMLKTRSGPRTIAV